MTPDQRVQLVTPDELGEVLGRARREGWTALAVVGGGN